MKKLVHNNKNKSIIITGGAGYIGSITAQLFKKQGWLPIIIDDLSTGDKENIFDLPFYLADYSDEACLRKIYLQHNPQIIMHFAASTIVSESMKFPSKYYNNNVNKFIKLLDNMAKYSINNIIFSSSAAVYGEPSQLPIEENHSTIPTNVYGHTKKICEEILYFYNKIYNINYISLRYFNAAGAAPEFNLGENHKIETHLIPNILSSLINNNKIFNLYGTNYPTKDGTCIRDFIHVIDIAEAHILAANYLINTKKSDIFNIGNEKGYSIKDVINTVNMIFKKDISIKIAPPRTGDPPILIANANKIKKILGWQPKYSDLQTIIRSQWQYMLSRYNNK